MDEKEKYVITTYFIVFAVYLTKLQQLRVIIGERRDVNARSVFQIVPRKVLGEYK
jgi:hypothetical protein